MKTIVLVTIFSLLFVVGLSQDNHRFKYRKIEGFTNYIVTPIFDQSKSEGIKGMPSILDESYIEKFFADGIKEVLPKEKLNTLHLYSSFMASFNSNGEIIYCTFFIQEKDINILSETDLYNLYDKFKKSRIDTSKVKILPVEGSEDKLPDYAEIFGPLVPRGYNKSISK
jgi:hypothetical protein